MVPTSRSASSKALLLSVFQKLQLKNDPFQVFMAATDDEIEELWNNILTIDETLTQKYTTKKALKMEKKLNKFIQHCCHVRHYVFSHELIIIFLYTWYGF